MNLKNINKELQEVETLLKESMSFYNEEDSIEEPSFEEEEMETEIETEPEVEKSEEPKEFSPAFQSHVDNIRKYALNGLSELCDSPESEEYQMLKKIFQMCDKKPEKKDTLSESHRLFVVNKENKNVIIESIVTNKNYKETKNEIISDLKNKGYNVSDYKLVSENKIII